MRRKSYIILSIFVILMEGKQYGIFRKFSTILNNYDSSCSSSSLRCISWQSSSQEKEALAAEAVTATEGDSTDE